MTDFKASRVKREPVQLIETEDSITEKLMLSAMMASPAVAEEYVYQQDVSLYSHKPHAMLYRCISQAVRSGVAPSLDTVFPLLEARRGWSEAVGGLDGLDDVMAAPAIAANAGYYHGVLLDRALRRQVIAAGSEMVQIACREHEEGGAGVLEQAESLLFSLGGKTASETMSTAEEVGAAFRESMRLRAEGGRPVGLDTGISALTRFLNGIQQPNLIFLGGRPGMGKSSLSHQVAVNIAVRERKLAVIFTAEMSREEVWSRLVCSMASLDAHVLESGKLSKREWDEFDRVDALLRAAPLMIDEKNAPTPAYIQSACRRAVTRHGALGLVVVDYVQLMRPDKDTGNRTQDLGQISMSLKAMCKTLETAMIVCAQVGRQVDARENKRPLLSDIRECGQFEADADIVAFCYNESEYSKADRPSEPEEGAFNFNPNPEVQEVEVIIRKFRKGRTGTVRLGFVGKFTRFEDLEEGLGVDGMPLMPEGEAGPTGF